MTVIEQCWEHCFNQNATHDNFNILRDIHKIGSDAKRIKDINDVNTVAFLLDTTVARFCKDSSSSSSESLSNELEGGATAEQIFHMQVQLMTIIATMMGSVYTYPVQFNQHAAWSCDEFSKLDECRTFVLSNGNYLTPVQTNSSACQTGLIEPACSLAFVGWENYNDNNDAVVKKQRMAIAILNSNSHGHVHKKSNYADYSPCHSYFHHRYAVGLHRANKDDLERFGSRKDYHEYLSDSLRSVELVNKLHTCMSASCCPANILTIPTVDECKIATGHTGEIITPVLLSNI